MRSAITSVACGLLLTGCASHLKTYATDGTPAKGLPVHTPVLAEVVRVISYKNISGRSENEGYCGEELVTTLETVPLGSIYYVNVDVAPFGKADFKVEYTDAGDLKTLRRGLDPGTASILESVGGLVTAALPLLKDTTKTGTAAIAALPKPPTAQESRDQHCLKIKTEIRSITQSKITPL